MPNPVVHFEVMGKDAAALQSFYGQVFDWQLNPVMPTYAMVSTGAEGGTAGGIGATPDGSDGHVTFYVEVDDLARRARADRGCRRSHRSAADGCAGRTEHRALRRSGGARGRPRQVTRGFDGDRLPNQRACTAAPARRRAGVPPRNPPSAQARRATSPGRRTSGSWPGSTRAPASRSRQRRSADRA